MADNLPVVWQAEPHTLAKHAILERYLQAWFPILTRQSIRVSRGSQEVLFIDGFAGPGEYKKGESGSPIIALTAALNHKITFPIPVRLIFIEQDAKRFIHLKQVVEKFSGEIQTSRNIVKASTHLGDCNVVLNEILDNHEKEGKRFGPAFAFLDQFGYSAVSMDLIQRIVQYPQCEVFSFLNYKEMNRWITDPKKVSNFSKAFGGEEWKKAIDLSEKERRTWLLSIYKKALHEKAGVKYVCSFSMYDEYKFPSYWLVFSTNNLRGLEVMKEAMWKKDKTGQFKFSDKDAPNQLNFLNIASDDNLLAEELCEKLADKVLKVSQIKEYVLTETPFYLYKKSLKKLEMRKDDPLIIIEQPPDRKPGKYPDDDLDRIRVKFPKKGLF